MEFIHVFQVWLEGFVANYGLFGLGVISFTESFIQPLPVSPFLALFIVGGADPIMATVVTIISNILGGIVGWWLGKTLGHGVAARLFGKRAMDHGERLYKKWGDLTLIVGAVTPVPYKLTTWLSGIFEMKFVRFLVISILGRTLQLSIAAFGGILLLAVRNGEFLAMFKNIFG